MNKFNFNPTPSINKSSSNKISGISFNLSSDNTTTSKFKESIKEENDDFESMFLSDISLPTTKSKKSVITNFKKDKNLCSNLLNNQTNKSIKTNFVDDLNLNTNNLNKFINNLKEIPILDMDHNLRKLINDKYLNLKKENLIKKTNSFLIFNLLYNRNYHSRYKFNIKNYFENYVENFYKNCLNECSDELIDCLENGVLG